MYSFAVPIFNENAKRSGREKYVNYLHEMKAERVFLALDCYRTDKVKKAGDLAELADNCAYFKACGFEVAAWIWTFLIHDKNSFTHMKTVTGKVSAEHICPSDKNFVAFAADYIADIAKTGVDMILFDDDFRFGHLDVGGFGCICDNHLKLVSERLGENVTAEQMKTAILYGGKNKYRSAWLSVNSELFTEFATEIRKKVDSVNPKIRVGACACITTWDIDGIDSASLSHILAGGTKPFIRLIGAPYWAVNKSWGNRLADIVELERAESSWCSDDIEVFAEGDCYPRPRYTTPSSYLEGFDTALRASGEIDGILKYVFDYTSSPEFELGYFKRHIAHREIYDGIDKLFVGKCTGIRVYEPMKKYESMNIPDRIAGSDDVQDILFSPAFKIAGCLSVPTVYDGDGVCGLSFGESIKTVPFGAYRNGMIIDAAAAKILYELGVDVGIKSFEGKVNVKEEYYIDCNEYVGLQNAEVVSVKLNEKVSVKSRFIFGDGETAGSYTYENKDGGKFLVLLFDALHAAEKLTRQYTRSSEVKEVCEKFFGNKLPAYVNDNPDLYIIAKRNEGTLSVGLWNFCADEVMSPEVVLDGEYSEIEYINCNGKLHGDRVILSDIPPYGFAGLCVK